MKFLRYGEAGQEKPGLLDASGKIRDLSGQLGDLAGAALNPDRLAELSRLDTSTLPVVEGTPRLGPCVAGTGKFICIGLNYSDHAAETGATVPPEPIIFMKATSAIVGPMMISSSRAARRRPIGKSSSASSSARRRNMSAKPMRSTMLPATARSTTSPNAPSRSSALASGPRASPATRSARPVPGLSPRTRCLIRRT